VSLSPSIVRPPRPPQRLEALRGGGTDDPKRLEAACKEFEALLVHELFKSMRRTVPKDGLLGESYARDTFTEMLDGELARHAASSGGIGLHRLLVDQLGAPGGPSSQPRLSHPLAGRGRVSSPFGPRRDPIDGGERVHSGLDLAAPTGEPVRSAAAGQVVRAGSLGGYGLVVDVRHRGGVLTRYAHLSELLVAKGERLARGQRVGRVGATGRATGPHLHFEVQIRGRPSDPVAFLERSEKSAQVPVGTADVQDE